MKNGKALVIIDVQKQFKDKNAKNYKKVLDFIAENKDDYDIVIATVFSNLDSSPFEERLNWYDCKNASDDDLEFDLKGVLAGIKHTYSAYSLIKMLNPENKKMDIIGCDLDGCVLATAFDLFDHEMDFTILSDYCYISGESENAKSRMKVLYRKLFGGKSLS